MDEFIRVILRDKDYSSILTESINNINLSWMARGIMGYLISSVPCTVDIDELVRVGHGRKTKTIQAIEELKNAGYIDFVNKEM